MENNISIHLSKQEGKKWIQLVGLKWQAVEKRVMNIQFPQNAENFVVVE